MTEHLLNIAEDILNFATKAGATAADAMIVQNSSMSIDVRQKALETAERSESTAIGLRVLIGQRQACVSSSDISSSTIKAVSQYAVAMASEAPIDPYCGLPEFDEIVNNWDIDTLELSDPTEEPLPEDLQTDALISEAHAADVEGVTKIESAGAGYSTSDVYLAATNGFSGGYRRTNRSIYCAAISGHGTGMEQDYDSDSRLFQSDLRNPDEIGRRAGKRAVARQGSRKPPTGNFPVLFDERVSVSLVRHLLMAVNGQSIATGTSWLRNSMNKVILPEHLSLSEDPHRPRTAGSRPFDAEGLSTNKRVIIDKGILRSWTLDCASARRLGLTSTANATRGISSPPTPTCWNISLTQGDSSRSDLIRDMGTGLIVTSLMGSTINPNTGDYSRGASGFWVENGAISYPINECTVAGNLTNMLRRIVPANDARTYLSYVVPSLLIEEMTLAGN
ncbi:MAG: TldD/PmbA family protein [Aestuariivita sp.]|nr:TldD/PmbA family protein [Aestuariivita sp.]